MHEQSETTRIASWFDLATVERWAVRLVRLPLIGDIGLIDMLLVVSSVLTWALHDEFEFWLYLIYAWLGIGAFFWTWRTFAVRGIVWVLISFALMVQKISIGEMEPDAFLERPPLLLLLVSIFVLARWRDQNAAKLEATNRELAQRVAELVKLSAELESSQEKLREMAEARATFLAHFSHELRTPLSAMLGYLEYVLEDAIVNSESEVADILRKTYDAGQHLLHLINETLDLARIDAGKTEVHITSFDLKQEIQTVIETIRPLRAIRLSVKGEPRSHKKWVYITVRDTGMGMSEEDLRLLFVPFTRAHVVRKTRGTGLGMPLTQRLVQLLGGDIQVQSAPGQGTTFVVRLPLEYRESL